MDIYLRSALPGYLLTGANEDVVQVTAGSPSAGVRSLITVNNINPVTRETPSDNTIRSGNYVVLLSRDGNYLTARDPEGLFRFMSDAGVSDPRVGSEVFQIFKVGGHNGDVLVHQDRVQIGVASLLPLAPPRQWLTADNPLRNVIFVRNTDTPGTPETFAFLLPTKITGFTLPPVGTVPYQGQAVITGVVTVTGGPGVGLPGGTAFFLTVNDTEFAVVALSPAIVPEGASSGAVEIVLNEHLGRFSPCDTRIVTVTCDPFETTGETFNQNLTLLPGRNPFMSMTLNDVIRGGCLLPSGIVGFLPWAWPSWYYVLATLFLDPDPGLDRTQSLAVSLSTDDSRISGLRQESQELSLDQPIKFSFSVQQQRLKEKDFCANLKAAFIIDGKEHNPTFAVIRNWDGVILDPH